MLPTLSLLLVCVCSAHESPVTTVLSCPDVYAALVSRIKCVGSDCEPTIAPADCMQNKLMRRLLTWTADAGIPFVDDNSGGVLWNTTSAQLSDLVALSMLGRAFVASQIPDAIFFEFHTGSSALSLRPLACEFQRPLYSIVLLTALFTLSFILISQYMHERRVEKT
jgi:hypothetical protein